MSNIDEKIARRLAKLDALEHGGVDNWEWYDEALKDWYAENENIEKAEAIVDMIFDEIIMFIEEPAGRGAGYGIKDEGYKIARDIILTNMELNK